MRYIIKPSVKDVYIPIKPIMMTADKDVEFACTLPDYAPDIMMPVRVGCNAVIKSSSVAAGKCSVELSANFELLYSAQNGKLKSACFSKEFSQVFDVSPTLVDAVSTAKAATTYVGCKMQDSRSPTFKAVIKTDLEIRGNTTVKMLDTESSGAACCKGETHSMQRRSLPLTNVCEISGDIALGRGDTAASEIISHSVLLPPPRVMQSEDGITLRSDAAVTVIYEGEKQGSGNNNAHESRRTRRFALHRQHAGKAGAGHHRHNGYNVHKMSAAQPSARRHSACHQ